MVNTLRNPIYEMIIIKLFTWFTNMVLNIDSYKLNFKKKIYKYIYIYIYIYIYTLVL
jgi:hypothetical protein